MNEIFISLASYRDEFLPFTIESALQNARYPENLRFGVCWQADDGENLDKYLDDLVPELGVHAVLQPGDGSAFLSANDTTVSDARQFAHFLLERRQVVHVESGQVPVARRPRDNAHQFD